MTQADMIVHDANPPQSEPQSSTPQLDFQTLDMAFLGSLLPGIIHNLATPLSGVLGATQLLDKRTSTIEDLLRDFRKLDEAERAELVQQIDRSRTNVEILSRNAQHLVDMLQTLVQRINRSASSSPEFCSLNDMVRSELRFLEANLMFKHKVTKRLTLCENLPLVKCVYGHVASALEEFAVGTIALHDQTKGNMEMEFSTQASGSDIVLTFTARYAPCEGEAGSEEPPAPYLARLAREGWTVLQEHSAGYHELKLARPRGTPAA